MQHSLGGYGGLKRENRCSPLTLEYCSPSNPGTPQNCLRRFCGEPHSGFPPPLGIGDSPLTWKYCYPLPAGFPLICPTENTFGGDPDRSPLKGDPPFRGKPDAIDALRSNRYTFGAARRDWRGAQQSLDLRFGHSYPLSSPRSENERVSR